MSDNEQNTELSDELAKKYDPERLLKMLSARAGRGSSLDASLRHRYEKRFGVDLSHVRVVTGEFAEAFTKQHNAYAVTVGGTGVILMGNSPDRSMASSAGKALLAHEVAHVAQAKRGVYASTRSDAMPFAAEHADAEADAEMHESQVAHEEQGGASASASAAGASSPEQAADLRKTVIDRVLELLGESGRVFALRNG